MVGAGGCVANTEMALVNRQRCRVENALSIRHTQRNRPSHAVPFEIRPARTA